MIGLSEYGADTYYKLQSPKPEKGDYSEQYQSIYHEHMLEMFAKRPYLWSTHVWNMFDFGADGRDEAGDNGVNHKGLVSFDRKVKKDAYYIYKVWWSKEPFIHICGSRYVDRPEEVTEIKVYSNLEKVALYKDGELQEEKSGSHVFVFQVPIEGIHKFEARSGAYLESPPHNFPRAKRGGLPIRSAESDEVKKYRPRFTYMGFRYMELSGAAYIPGLITSYLFRRLAGTK